jgi:hypothetical protein
VFPEWFMTFQESRQQLLNGSSYYFGFTAGMLKGALAEGRKKKDD